MFYETGGNALPQAAAHGIRDGPVFRNPQGNNNFVLFSVIHLHTRSADLELSRNTH